MKARVKNADFEFKQLTYDNFWEEFPGWVKGWGYICEQAEGWDSKNRPYLNITDKTGRIISCVIGYYALINEAGLTVCGEESFGFLYDIIEEN